MGAFWYLYHGIIRVSNLIFLFLSSKCFQNIFTIKPWSSIGYRKHPSERFRLKMDSRSMSLLNDRIEFLILHFSNLKCISKINLKFVYFMQKNINKQIFIQHFILQKRFWLIRIQIKHFVQCHKKSYRSRTDRFI